MEIPQNKLTSFIQISKEIVYKLKLFQHHKVFKTRAVGSPDNVYIIWTQFKNQFQNWKLVVIIN